MTVSRVDHRFPVLFGIGVRREWAKPKVLGDFLASASGYGRFRHIAIQRSQGDFEFFGQSHPLTGLRFERRTWMI